MKNKTKVTVIKDGRKRPEGQSTVITVYCSQDGKKYAYNIKHKTNVNVY